MHPPFGDGELTIHEAVRADASDVLALQKLAFQSQAQLYDDWSLPPLTQTMESLLEEFEESLVLKAIVGGRLVGSVRAAANGDTCEVRRLIVHPGAQRRGIGSALLQEVERRFDAVSKFRLFTGSRSERSIRLYERHGYVTTETRQQPGGVTLVFLEKHVRDGMRPR